MEERLQKIIARSGMASRRAAEQMIAQGRVIVDGVVVKELGARADPEVSDIRVDGVRVRPGRPRRYLALHKPVGYVTTRSDPGRRQTVMELLPLSLRSLYPVGRLDMSTSGLLLLTDDGELAQRVAHPRYGIPKTYLATVWGHPDERILERARKGVRVEGDLLRVMSVEPVKATARRKRSGPQTGSLEQKMRLRVVLTEGKHHEVRRLFKALGHPVLELHRESVGPVSVRGLPPGAYRPLTPAEIRGLASPGPAAPRRGRKK